MLDYQTNIDISHLPKRGDEVDKEVLNIRRSFRRCLNERTTERAGKICTLLL